MLLPSLENFFEFFNIAECRSNLKHVGTYCTYLGSRHTFHTKLIYWSSSRIQRRLISDTTFDNCFDYDQEIGTLYRLLLPSLVLYCTNIYSSIYSNHYYYLHNALIPTFQPSILLVNCKPFNQALV